MAPFHPRRTRHVAMKDDRRYAQERRDRGRAGQGVVAPRRSPSPAPRRPRDRDRDVDTNPRGPQPHRRPPTERADDSRKSKSRNRSRDPVRRPSPSPGRRGQDRDDRYFSHPRDLLDNRRDRGEARGRNRRTPSPNSRHSHGARSISPPAKRPRSRSPTLPGSDRKRPRRDISPPRRGRDRDRDLRVRSPDSGAHLSVAAGPRRSLSPNSKGGHTRNEGIASLPQDRGRAQSPIRENMRQGASPSRAQESSRSHRPTRSPRSPFHRSPRRRSPDSRRARRSISPRGDNQPSRPSQGRDGKGNRSRHTSRSTSRGSGRRKPKTDDLLSGPNSVEVNMAGRGHRDAFGARHQMHNTFSNHSGYNDSHGHAQSSRGAPNPYHNSPGDSPYGRGNWGGSPHHQYPNPHPSDNYGPQGNQQAHHPGNNTYSPPPSAPTGPGQSYSRGGYRGGGNGRGNQFGPGRGNYRGNAFKSTQWNSNSQNASSRGGFSEHDDVPHNQRMEHDSRAEEHENPFRPSKDLQVEDNGVLEKLGDDDMPPPKRLPPSGPASQSATSSKFSFAFKASTKPAPAAPKPEISQKFNAIPQRREPVSQPEQPQSEQRQPEQHQPENTNKDRGVPHGAPTEPASARGRHEQRNQPPSGPKPPPQGPRTRTIQKKMKRLKHRETLPTDLVGSDSVYFRKPGNESVVGSGTYGKVFKGLHVYTKKLVALKRIRMEGEKDGFPVTAVREIKLLQSLRHPNIVSLQEVMVEKNDCFMVFEYLSHDLTGILNHPTFKLDDGQRKHLARQIFEGLDYLHVRGVLHRDLKAANILVSSDGILKLADFGLARFYAKRHQLDYTNRVITIWYRSPELLFGETRYGPACDIWSTACIMMEIFTRHATFPGDGTETNQLDKIYSVVGTPNKAEWPGLVDMPWFELLRPGYRRANTFAAKYKDKLSQAAYDLISSIFQYDPDKRPTAAESLAHPYFTSEEPSARQAVELATHGDWHELESKAYRKENERKEKEARQASRKDGNKNSKPPQEKERGKRENESHDQRGPAKRLNTEVKPSQDSDHGQEQQVSAPTA